MEVSMSDMMDDFAALKQLHRQRRSDRAIQNVLLINASSIPFEYRRRENVYLFRDPSGPICDFYPPSGRWKDNGNRSKWYSGGAKSFIHWYQATANSMRQQANDNQKP
jgi:hypothetical protein